MLQIAHLFKLTNIYYLATADKIIVSTLKTQVYCHVSTSWYQREASLYT